MVDMLGLEKGPIPDEEVVSELAAALGASEPETIRVLWDHYHPNIIWYYMAAAGVVALAALYLFSRVTWNRTTEKEILISTDH